MPRIRNKDRGWLPSEIQLLSEPWIVDDTIPIYSIANGERLGIREHMRDSKRAQTIGIKAYGMAVLECLLLSGATQDIGTIYRYVYARLDPYMLDGDRMTIKASSGKEPTYKNRTRYAAALLTSNDYIRRDKVQTADGVEHKWSLTTAGLWRLAHAWSTMISDCPHCRGTFEIDIR